MRRSPPWPRRPRWRRRLRGSELGLIALLLLAVVVVQYQPEEIGAALRTLPWFEIEVFCAFLIAGVAAMRAGLDLLIWHAIATRTLLEKPQIIARPRVVDGDTIDDCVTGVRYRLANIDAPETGDNAKCARERIRGEAAAREAANLIMSAKIVSVRRTWRNDIYGRRVAFVLIDGVDLGGMLVKRGLARPWNGKRRKWCGKNGGLAKIAAAGAAPHECGTCRDWK